MCWVQCQVQGRVLRGQPCGSFPMRAGRGPNNHRTNLNCRPDGQEGGHLGPSECNLAQEAQRIGRLGREQQGRRTSTEERMGRAFLGGRGQ